MRSIFTKFVGATNARGARIVAKVNDWKAGDPGKVSVPFDYASRNPHDVAVEALRDCLRKRKARPADIFEMAKVDRVARVMRPYLEALT